MVENDLLPKLAKEKKLAAFKFNGKWLDCGTWQRYERALKIWEV
jgi:NDP-sugar pyrophosphorylase family protein